MAGMMLEIHSLIKYLNIQCFDNVAIQVTDLCSSLFYQFGKCILSSIVEHL